MEDVAVPPPGNEYGALHEDVDREENEYIRGRADVISHTMTEADRLLIKARNSQEVKSDASLIHKLSDMTYKKVRSGASGTDLGGVTLDNFIDKMKTLLASDGGNVDAKLTRIGDLAFRFLNKVPTTDFMLGPISFERKVQASRQTTKRLRINENESTNPRHLQTEDMSQNEELTSKLISSIYRHIVALYRENPIPIGLYQLILNPQSFSQSVENLFYTSFLVRDGRLRLKLDENELPIVEPVIEDENDSINTSARSADPIIQQVVVDLDMPLWKELVQVLNITESTIATRQSVI